MCSNLKRGNGNEKVYNRFNTGRWHRQGSRTSGNRRASYNCGSTWGLKFEFEEFPYSCNYYLEHGVMMDADGLDKLKNFDSIFSRSRGDANLWLLIIFPFWGLLIKIRREFEQVINLRPAKLVKGVRSPLINPKDFDIMVVRENSEGEYGSVGGRIFQGEDEIAIQNAIFSKKGTERAMRFAFDLAAKRKKHVTSATKSNGIPFHVDLG